MKVTAIWKHKNPFAQTDTTRTQQVNFFDKISLDEIYRLAEEVTPEGFYLQKIVTPDRVYEYDQHGKLIEN